MLSSHGEDKSTPSIDSYCHLGLPRFSTAADAWTTLEQISVDKAVLVLGPLVPDYTELFAAIQRFGSRVRGVGIPFGQTLSQILEISALQLRAGALGLRVQEPDLLTSDDFLRLLGERGRWLYAINLFRTPEVTRFLLDWLNRYPNARIAAPHLLSTDPLFGDSSHDDIRRGLLSHPRFFPIFSRHGGVGSRKPYPHVDLRPWVEQIIELSGWERILWGSEYPVLYWRNESMASCRDWLSKLLPDVQERHLQSFLGGNAESAIFSQPPPHAEPVTIPRWVAAQFDQDRTIPLFEAGGIDVPMSTYRQLHHGFVQELAQNPELTFAAFVVSILNGAAPQTPVAP